MFTWTNLADCKTIRSNSLKKAHLKPTKGPKTLLETFKTLPTDDFEFIKQLDKQFNKFGDHIKIKLHKVNKTSTLKNSKRTVDGELGVLGQDDDQQSSFSFSKPRFEFYPYSQQDIPPRHQHQQSQNHYVRHQPTALVESDSHYYNKESESPHASSVEVHKSQSYEIKETEDGSYQTIYDGDNGQPANEEEPVPVIVLRVPGANKYAAHLQALLQQYLEARATQYLQALQEQEAHGIDHSQQYNQVQEQDLSAYSGLPVLPYGTQQAFLPNQMYIQPIQQIQPYFGPQALESPYANAHIAQAIETDDVSPNLHYYTHAHAHAHTQAHAQSEEVHQGKHFFNNFTSFQTIKLFDSLIYKELLSIFGLKTRNKSA